MRAKEEILSELTGIPIYRLHRDDEGEFITKRGALQAMEEYASQYRQEQRIVELEEALRECKTEALFANTINSRRTIADIVDKALQKQKD